MPPDPSCLHAKCGPSEPCLGSHVPLGPRIWPFWGALGAISSVGDRFCLLGTQLGKTTILTRTRRHRGVFERILAHRKGVRVGQLSYSDDVWGFQPSFSRKSRFTGFWKGLAGQRNSGPQPTKKLRSKKKRKKSENFFFRCGFKKCVLVKNGVIFCCLWPLVPPIGAVRTGKS